MSIRFLFLLCLIGLAATPQAVRSQVVDATFAPTVLYRPGPVSSVAQQADGKFLVFGSFTRNTTGPIGRLLRFNTDFTPDGAFNAATATLTGGIYSVRVLPNGQLLVVGEGALALAGTTRQDLLRLNSDGTPDPAFDAGTASTVGSASVVEPLANGQLLVGGTFTSYNGQARTRLVRLTATGALDAAFVAPALPNTVVRVVVQPDGKAVVATQTTLRRLNTDGSTDPSFAIGSSSAGLFGGLVLQPDGKVLVTGSGLPYTGSPIMARLLADGRLDGTFGLPVGLVPSIATSLDSRLLLLQPDGRIVLGLTSGGLVRLTASGSVDASFQTPLSARSNFSWLALAASGQVLAAGTGFELPGRRSNLALLSSSGALEPGLAPVLLTNGYLEVLAPLPNGAVLAAGNFDEVNGVLASNLVRFLADGSVDPGFAPPPFLSVKQLLVQPDGNVLVAQSGRTSLPAIIRLLPSGAKDASFDLRPGVNTLAQVRLLPDGRLVALVDTSGLNPVPVRLLANGRRDRSFTTTISGMVDIVRSVAVQPDGKLVLGGSVMPGGQLAAEQTVLRLLPNGAADPAFTPLSGANGPFVTSVSLQPSGNILVVDNGFARMRRLLPNGTPDGAFSPGLPATATYLFKTLVQPNGRILVSGGFPSYLMRLLPDGPADASFASPAFDNVVNDLAIDPNGRLLAAGSFLNFGGQARTGIVRLTVSNVLPVRSGASPSNATAFPNPATAHLHLRLDVAARPQQVKLLDAQGRVVLRQLGADNPDLTLDTSGLAPGLYLLQVDYVAGTARQRIVIE